MTLPLHFQNRYYIHVTMAFTKSALSRENLFTGPRVYAVNYVCLSLRFLGRENRDVLTELCNNWFEYAKVEKDNKIKRL